MKTATDARRYWRFLLPVGAVAAVLILLLVMLANNVVYFKTPTEIAEGVVDIDDRLRLGGQVAAGTVTDTTDGVSFLVTDGRMSVSVVHVGAPQALFREGIGVVLEGKWDGSVFRSDTMLIKHGEQYRTEDGVYEAPGDLTDS